MEKNKSKKNIKTANEVVSGANNASSKSKNAVNASLGNKPVSKINIKQGIATPNAISNNQPKTIKKFTIEDYIFKYWYLIIIFIALLAYGQSLAFGLVNCDDNGIFSHFDYYKDLKNLTRAFFEGYYGGVYYRPMITASFIIDSQFGGADSHFFNHFSNLIFHIISCLGIYWIISSLNYKKIYGLIAGSVYACHPLFINAEAWLNGRNDLLVGMFALYSFLSFIHFKKNSNWLIYLAHLLLFLFATFSKELGLILPLVCVMYIIFIEQKKIIDIKNIALALGWIVVGTVWLLMRSAAHIGAPEELSGISQFLTNLPTLPEFITKFFVPYCITGLPVFRLVPTLIGLAIIIAIVVLSFLQKDKRLKYILFGTAWLLIFVIPGMFKRMNNANDFFDYLDCRAYLPMLGMFIILFELIPKKFYEFNIKNMSVHCGIIIIFLVITLFKVSDYKSPIVFWQQIVKDNPDKPVDYRQLGIELQALNRHSEAEKILKKGWSLNPKYEREIFFVQLGLVYINKKDMDKAIQMFYRALDESPHFPVAVRNLAMGLYDRRRYFELAFIAKDAMDLYPNDKDLMNKLLIGYFNSFKYEEAEKMGIYLSKLGDPNPLKEYYIRRSDLFYEDKQRDSVIVYSNKLLKVDPNNAVAYNQLGIIYADRSDFLKAISCWKKSYQLNPHNPQSLYNLYKLYLFNLSNFKEAADCIKIILKNGGTVDPQHINMVKNFL